jgi:hypothetical protein
MTDLPGIFPKCHSAILLDAFGSLGVIINYRSEKWKTGISTGRE